MPPVPQVTQVISSTRGPKLHERLFISPGLSCVVLIVKVALLQYCLCFWHRSCLATTNDQDNCLYGTSSLQSLLTSISLLHCLIVYHCNYFCFGDHTQWCPEITSDGLREPNGLSGIGLGLAVTRQRPYLLLQPYCLLYFLYTADK